MRLTIFAATGGIGRQLLEQAIGRGHRVTAVVRSPQALGAATSTVRAVQADLSKPDPGALAAAIAGADAVLSGLGPRSRREHGIVSRGTRAIVDAMTETGVRRIVVVSVAGIITIPTPGRPHPPKRDPGAGPLLRYLLNPISHLVLGNHYRDVALMEDQLRSSGIDFTAVGVPVLSDQPFTGNYRTARDQSVPGGLKISRADAAHYMLSVLEDPETVRQSIGIGY